jgi:hypothetical protein
MSFPSSRKARSRALKGFWRALDGLENGKKLKNDTHAKMILSKA